MSRANKIIQSFIGEEADDKKKKMSWWNNKLLPTLKKVGLDSYEFMGLSQRNDGTIELAGLMKLKDDKVITALKNLGLSDVKRDDKFYSGPAWKTRVIAKIPSNFVYE